MRVSFSFTRSMMPRRNPGMPSMCLDSDGELTPRLSTNAARFKPTSGRRLRTTDIKNATTAMG